MLCKKKKKEKRNPRNNLLFVWMLDTFNCKRTALLQAIITYVCAFLFESQLTAEAFCFDSQPLYLSFSDYSFQGGCSAEKIKCYTETA